MIPKKFPKKHLLPKKSQHGPETKITWTIIPQELKNAKSITEFIW